MNIAEKKTPKAIALMSGGLDSALAVSIMQDLGVEVEAVYFSTPFCNPSSSRKVSESLGISLRVESLMPEYLDIVKQPKHGHGSNMNPCIDCHILMLKKARDRMAETGADFVVTGEVLGQRPMSQHRHALELIERESGLEGLIVRPLSAGLLPPSLPETEGLIDREKLLTIQGRNRKTQLQLAAEKGITGYSTPAGGCLLTDPIFSNRLRDLFEHHPEAGMTEINLLKYGRHFRLPDGSRIIVGRDKAENEKLEELGGDYCRFQVDDARGPLTLAPRGLAEETKRVVAAITGRYSQGRQKKSLLIRITENGKEEFLRVAPACDEEFAGWRIE